jgi:hypothetical protein
VAVAVAVAAKRFTVLSVVLVFPLVAVVAAAVGLHIKIMFRLRREVLEP